MLSFDIKELNKYCSKNKIRKSINPGNGLLIWNYTENQQFYKDWDPITLQCRGLVTDSLGNVVARSFPKFFNMEQYTSDNPDVVLSLNDAKIYDKVDGSLGILFFYEKEWIFASRGSFTSEQSVKGFSMFPKEHLDSMDKNISYIFEIIYPENRIVIDYGLQEKLVYLSSFEKDGTEVSYRDFMTEIGVEVVEEIERDLEMSLDSLKEENLANKEGYVVKFNDGLRLKIKFEDYITMHKKIENCTAKNIFNSVRNGKTLDEIIEDVPDEFHESVAEIVEMINQEHKNIFEECMRILETVNKDNKAIFAKCVSGEKYKRILFLIFDNREYKNVIYDFINVETLEKTFSDCSKSRKMQSMKTYKKVLKKNLIFLVGPSCSGKSTWAQNYIKNNKDSIIVSRDSLRKLLFGLQDTDLEYYYSRKNYGLFEKVVTENQELLIKNNIKSKNVIIDNTNLDIGYIKNICKCIGNEIENINIKFQFFDTSIEKCLERNKERVYQSPERIINKQFKAYLGIRERLDDNFIKSLQGISENVSVPVSENVPENIKDPSKKSCIICDIDGTIAENTGRSPYDMTRVLEDIPIEVIVDLVKTLGKTYTIIMCTGRSEDAKESTERWLQDYKIPFHEVHYRPYKNNEKDFIIKERMWKKISEDFNILFMLDDRNQVVNHARKLGFRVLQVAEGNF